MSDADRRIDIVAAILSEPWPTRRPRELAARIIDALDQRAAVTKWDGGREKVFNAFDVRQLWIPEHDLVEYLNTLPGTPLTVADLRAKLANFYRWRDHRNPDLQTDCLRVYQREKAAGTAFTAILRAIVDDVIAPAFARASDDSRRQTRLRREKLAESGKDFGFIPRVEAHSPDFYGRFAGQLYRLIRVATDKYACFAVDNVGEKGRPTEPLHFAAPRDAREAIMARKVRVPGQ